MHADEAKEKFSEANRLYKAGSYAAALVLLEELRAAFPVEKNVLYAYTLCLQSLGRRDDALISVNQLQALGDPRAEQLRASLMTRQELPRLEPRTVRRKQIIVGVAVGVVILAAIGLAYSRGVFNSHAQNLQSANSAEGPSAFTTSQPSTVFNLDTEVKCIEDEIQQGKGVPPVLDKSNPNWKYWQRESYQDIIDATLKARLGGRADQIEVPNNIIGKNPLRIRYISKNPPTEMVWGDDELPPILRQLPTKNKTIF